ncbi:MAG: PIN-like domain-containing protein [Victivallaceae bacterium]|nr:PIN-like domain-containing protein [Victivallaceae bacterium]
MKKTFSWHFPLSEEKIDEIWKKGLLTVDANVLLDLYRYNVATKDKLLEVLEKFKDRAWLTHQTAFEFFENKTNVIVETQRIFDQILASDEFEELKKNINKLKETLSSTRILSKALTERSISVFEENIEATTNAIREEKEKLPDYLHNDSILEKLALFFDGKIGPEYSKEEKEAQKKIAQERFEKLIPPGFKDEKKNSDEKYGDYFFWHQVLEKSRTEKKDVILVTSERKEDWWEKIHGKIIGPRKELLEEATKIANQVILIYRTEYFLELAVEKLKVDVSAETVEEVKAVRDDNDSCVALLEHNVTKSSDMENSGIIKFSLKREKFKFTCSGHFAPHLSKVPLLDVKLIQSPINLPKYSVHCGTGTQFDFNIHIKSWTYGVPLPAGEYTFEYRASCGEQPAFHLDS